MEVLILNDFCSVNGGAAYVALASARELARRGVPVTFMGAVGPVGAELDHPGIRTVCLEQKDILRNPNRLESVVQGVYNRQAHQALEALLEKKNPEETIIHLHGFMKALSPCVLKLALDRKFRVVHTLHDYSISCPNGGFLVYPTSAICHRKPLGFSCLTCNCDSRSYNHKLWRTARIALQNKVWSLDRRLRFGIFPSQLTQQILAPYLPGLKKNRVILYPVHAVKAEPAEPSRHEALVFVGRLSREKGILLLAEAARRTQLPLVIIGDGDAGLKDSVRQINPGAEFTGWLSQSASVERVRQSRALVMPSLWYETLGLAAVEAMAQGVPVIVPDQCAIKDYVRNGTTGLMFTQGSVDDLCAKIDRLKDGALAAKMGRAAYDWYWSDPWTVERHVDGLQQFYGEVMGEEPVAA